MKETVYETFSAAETHALGKKIGETARPGDVYTLVGDLGVGKTVFTQGIADGLGYGDNTKAALITRGVAEISRLGMYRCMKKEECRFIILMYTGSATSRRWTRSVMRITFTGKVCA